MMYGSAHSSIIGFISTEWINLSKDNSILDGAPSSITGKVDQTKRTKRIADLLLCKGNKPRIVVEVESGVSKYTKKIESISDYLKNTNDFDGLQWGLMVMSNVDYSVSKKDKKNKKDKKDENYVQYKHNWEKIKKKVKEEYKDSAIALVSIEKSRTQLDDSTLGRLRRRNNYYPWDIVNIDYWIHSGNHDVDVEGNLWNKKIMKPIYDQNGQAVGWLLNDDVVYNIVGLPRAFIRREGNIFNYKWNYLGRLDQGFFRDKDGNAVAFIQGATGGPIPPIPAVAPVPPIPATPTTFPFSAALPVSSIPSSKKNGQILVGKNF